MMRKVDLDKIMIQNMGISISDLPLAIGAYKAKLVEFKQETPRIPDLSTLKPTISVDEGSSGGDSSLVQSSLVESDKSDRSELPMSEPFGDDSNDVEADHLKSTSTESVQS